MTTTGERELTLPREMCEIRRDVVIVRVDLAELQALLAAMRMNLTCVAGVRGAGFG